MKEEEEEEEEGPRKVQDHERNTRNINCTLALLYSDPLVDRIAIEENNNHTSIVELPRLDCHAEILLLKDTLNDANRALSFRLGVASKTQLMETLVNLRPTILHILGHGLPDSLAFEDEFGAVDRVRLNELQEILKVSEAHEFLKVVFVSACYSQSAGEVFASCGVPHVVCVRLDQQVSDKSARVFAKRFYFGLIQGQTVSTAFNTAQIEVQHIPGLSVASLERQKGKYILLPLNSKHDVVILNTLAQGSLLDITKPLPRTSCDRAPSPFIGRQIELQHCIESIIKNRCLVIAGAPRIGKSALGLSLCEYLSDRHVVDIIHFIPFARALRIVQGMIGTSNGSSSNFTFPSTSQDITRHYYRQLFQLLRAGCSGITPSISATQTPEQLFHFFRSKRVLLVLDGYERWCQIPSPNNSTALSSASFSSSTSDHSGGFLEPFSQSSDSSSFSSALLPLDPYRKDALIAFVQDFLKTVQNGLVLLTGTSSLEASPSSSTPTLLNEYKLDPLSLTNSAQLFLELSNREIPIEELLPFSSSSNKKTLETSSESLLSYSSRINLLSKHPVIVCLSGNPQAILEIATLMHDPHVKIGTLLPNAMGVAQRLGLPEQARKDANLPNRRHASNNNISNEDDHSENSHRLHRLPSAESSFASPILSPNSTSRDLHKLKHQTSSATSVYTSPSAALHSSFQELWRDCMVLSKSGPLTWTILVAMIQNKFSETLYGEFSHFRSTGAIRLLSSTDLYEIRDKLNIQTRTGNDTIDGQAQVSEDILHNFWSDWFEPTLNMVALVEPYWTSRCIYGFISRQDCESMLDKSKNGTFLIRVSCSKPGELALSFKHQDRIRHSLLKPSKTLNTTSGQCGFEVPFDTGSRYFSSLTSAVLNAPLLVYLYPEIKKEQAFLI